MTIAWSKTYTKMDHADWNVNGAATFSDDAWNPAAALDGDSANNSVDQAAIITTADGSSHTIGFWYKSTADVTNQILYSQGDITVDQNQIQIFGRTTGMMIIAQDGTAANRLLTSYTGGLSDGTFHHYIVAIDGPTDKCDLYEDGGIIQTTTLSGTGWNGCTVDRPTWVGSNLGTGSFLRTGSAVTRVKVARTDYASAAEALEEYNAEVAAQGEGFAVPDLGNRDFQRYLERYFNRTFR